MIYTTESFIGDIATGGLLEPVGRRSPFTMSRIAILADGTMKPVLTLLAERKFGTWDTASRFPFWIDGDRTNETLENVDLATRPASRASGRRRLRNSFGVPSGTKEYMTKWREKNRDRVQASQRRYADRRRKVLDAVTSDVSDLPEVFEHLVEAVKEETSK